MDTDARATPGYRAAKVAHLIGLAMFLGSILGHITIGFVPGANEEPGAMLLARQAIDLATWMLTVPGLTLLVASGIAMTFNGNHGFGRRRWLSAHQFLALLILLNAGLVLPPTGGALLALATGIDADAGTRATFAALQGREAMFGAANLLIAVLTIIVAVFRPRLGQNQG